MKRVIDMSLKGEKIACFGDSTTWGDNGIGTGGNQISWTTQIKPLVKASEVTNLGVKGSRMGIKADRTDSFVERWQRGIDLSGDVIVVFGGVNDFERAVPLGKMGSEDPHTFYGAVNTLVTGIVGRYPEAQVVFLTPCKSGGVVRKGLPPFYQKNEVGEYEEAYADTVLEVCAHYAVPTIDLFRTSGISPLIPEQQKLYMPDGLHYSCAGYGRLAHRIAAGLNALTYFED
ncbi:SGNH/GDSL hydrolase family protein [Atopobium sp. oral taxon 416]|jgi:lysophospholipase L1-like esterase|nr:SGNH/GDSL hydrolase family protein [Atopobium sp. oral taxon 416]